MAKEVISGATPLAAVSAIAFDTETTGLDPAADRIIEMGAMAIRRGAVIADDTFSSFVKPGIPVPPASTAIHHIDDAMVADAPSYAEALKAFLAFAGGRILVGHSIGFDIAVMAAEAERHGLKWQKPRSLCIRMLGIIAAGELPDYSLDALASRLGIEIEDRHRALADAEAAARVFVGLVPLLEKRGIRTLAEAERAVLGLQSELNRHASAGWHDPVLRSHEVQAQRGDPFAYQHRISDVMASPPVCVAEDLAAGEAIELMASRKISSLFVGNGGKPGGKVADYGIVTERDMMRAIAANGAKALTMPVGPLAARPLKSVRAAAFVYRAIGRMDRLKIRHLAVRSEDHELVGIVSARDMLRLRASAQIALDDRIEDATSPVDLAQAWSSVPAMADSLAGEDIPARTITAIISEEIRALTRAAARLAEDRMAADGKGRAPCPYCIMVLGSGGRGESLLKPDQDNAVVYDPAPGAPDPDPWFAEFGEHMNAFLDQAGIPFCDGGIMVRNPQWRGTPDAWHKRVGEWLSRANPQDILNADIFFDFMPVQGDTRLGEALFRLAYEEGSRNIGFAKALAAGLERVAAPVTMFGGFRLTDGRVDLKLHGLFPIVAFARAAAIRHCIAERSTEERLLRLSRDGHVPPGDISMLNRAHELIIGLMLEQQRIDIMAGLKPSNSVDPAWLSSVQKAQLKKALTDLSITAQLARDTMF